MPHRDDCALRLFLVRHGHVDYPANSGNDDPPLSPTGESQARRLCRYFRGMRLERVLASPALRTHQTVRHLVRPHGLTPETHTWLRECVEMFRYSEDELASPHMDWEGFPLAGKVRERENDVRRAIDLTIQQYGLVRQGMVWEGQLGRQTSLLLCGHAGSLSMVAAHLLSADPTVSFLSKYVENAAVSMFEISRHDFLPSRPYRCYLRFWNRPPVPVCWEDTPNA